MFATLTLVTALVLGTQDDTAQIFQLFLQGHAEEAVARAQAFADAEPDNPMGHHLLGRFCVYQQQFADAIPHLERCLELDPPEAWAVAWTHEALGEALAGVGRNDEAIAHLKKAVELDATANSTAAATKALRSLGVDVGGPPEETSPWVGKEVPDFLFWDLAGREFRPRDRRGRATLYKLGPSW